MIRRHSLNLAHPMSVALALGWFAVALGAGPAGAENAWVRGAPLNLRAGAGTQFKIQATVKVGERVEILKRGERWTQIRKPDGRSGWIAAGYLDPHAPPSLRVEQLSTETDQLRADLERTTADAAELRDSHTSLQEEDATRANEFERIQRENLELRAGARWPEWITGALILSTGMALGAGLRGVSGRRRQSRLRL